MRALFALSFGAALLLLGPFAAGARAAVDEADDVESSDPPPPVAFDEAPVLLRLRLAPGIARMTERHTLTNVDRQVGEGMLDIELPDGAAATGVRSIVPLPAGQTRPVAGVLFDAHTAELRYAHSSVAVGTRPADTVLLQWIRSGILALRVQPLLPGLAKEIEYDYEIATDFREGASHLVVPEDNDPETGRELELWPATPEDELTVDGRIVPAGARVPLDVEHDVSVRRVGAAPLAVDAVSLPLASGRTVAHLELRAADPLEPAPRRARVVVAVDTSRSIRHVSALFAAAAAYVREMPDAEVSALAFHRRVVPLWTGFAAQGDAAARLDRLARRPPALANGSEVGAALAAADTELASAPKGRARRVVVFGDLETRATLEPAKVPPLASGALVHLVALRAPGVSLARDDDAEWAQVASRTGGVTWSGNASADPEDMQDMAHAFEELAHPLRIDDVEVASAFPLAEDLGIPSVLAAGEGFQSLALAAKPYGPVQVTGRLWSRPLTVAARRDADLTRTWAGLAAARGAAELTLTDAEVTELAWRGGVVSPSTSFVCAPPGRRRVAERGDGGAIRGVRFGSGHLVGRSTSPPRPSPSRDLARVLHDMLAAATRGCAPRSRPATVSIETTRVEVVDVPAVSLAAAASTDADAACVREAAWGLTLPADFDLVARRVWEVELAP